MTVLNLNGNSPLGKKLGLVNSTSRGTSSMDEGKVFDKRPTPTSYQETAVFEGEVSFAKLAALEWEHSENVREMALAKVAVLNDVVISQGHYNGHPSFVVYLDQLASDGYRDERNELTLNALDWEIFPDLIGYNKAMITRAHENSASGKLRIVLAGDEAPLIIGDDPADPNVNLSVEHWTPRNFGCEI